jgi:uncharacterized BrkB/YihY/UPF0761 family membrane protein
MRFLTIVLLGAAIIAATLPFVLVWSYFAGVIVALLGAMWEAGLLKRRKPQAHGGRDG